ncbi:hypothetical protein AGDE_13855 [Angomonas deanei]|uniref:MINDY4 N-terminal dimerisation domain-containing protein n=1 Tax=Angomonas deanei TaxID=59799 RepID=A0A7G2CIH2_9TRYP|nr:hypothetical protein AGDE_13855 [Angomonas deanei]CAD2219219.1 hypothetical protein, conserved [Angomonas deanei]|eukprot:EPY21661.1 hypothetical protein AGDE_13855 [Angomonas deanei]
MAQNKAPNADDKRRTAELVASLSEEEQAKLLAQALLREYMHKRGYRATLAAFDKENPRDEKTISSRAVMHELLNIPVEGRPSRLLLMIQKRLEEEEDSDSSEEETDKKKKKKKSAGKAPVALTFMEELCSYRLTKRDYELKKKGAYDAAAAVKQHGEEKFHLEEEDPSDTELEALESRRQTREAERARAQAALQEYEELLEDKKRRKKEKKAKKKAKKNKKQQQQDNSFEDRSGASTPFHSPSDEDEDGNSDEDPPHFSVTGSTKKNKKVKSTLYGDKTTPVNGSLDSSRDGIRRTSALMAPPGFLTADMYGNHIPTDGAVGSRWQPPAPTRSGKGLEEHIDPFGVEQRRHSSLDSPSPLRRETRGSLERAGLSLNSLSPHGSARQSLEPPVERRLSSQGFVNPSPLSSRGTPAPLNPISTGGAPLGGLGLSRGGGGGLNRSEITEPWVPGGSTHSAPPPAFTAGDAPSPMPRPTSIMNTSGSLAKAEHRYDSAAAPKQSALASKSNSTPAGGSMPPPPSGGIMAEKRTGFGFNTGNNAGGEGRRKKRVVIMDDVQAA